MSVNVPSEWFDSPEAEELGPEGRDAILAMCADCDRNALQGRGAKTEANPDMADGRMPKKRAARHAGRKLLEKLVRLGQLAPFADAHGDAFRVTKFKDFCRTSEELLATRARWRKDKEDTKEQPTDTRNAEKEADSGSEFRDGISGESRESLTGFSPTVTVPSPSPSLSGEEISRPNRPVGPAREGGADGDDDLVGMLRTLLGDRARGIDRLEQFVEIAGAAPRPREVLEEAAEQFAKNRGPMRSPGGILRRTVEKLVAQQVEDDRARAEARKNKQAAQLREDAEAAERAKNAVDPRTLPKAALRPPPDFDMKPRRIPNDWEPKAEPTVAGNIMAGMLAKAGGAS